MSFQPTLDAEPLANRKEIVADMMKIPLQTGDILFRHSNARGPFGIPFSWLVAKLTNSDYSHASVVVMENGQPEVFEISDKGTLKYRLIDWLDFVVGGKMHVYRLKKMNDGIRFRLQTVIYEMLNEDADYDFSFADPTKYYCVEAVAEVYKRAGIPLVEPELMKDVVKPWQYRIIAPINAIVRRLTGKGFDVTTPLYYVGNSKRGMMSSPLIKPVKRFALTTH